MNPTNQPVNNIIEQLQERAKELHTLYKVHELINQQDASIDEVCQALIGGGAGRLAVPERLLGAHHARQHGVPAAARDRDPVGAARRHHRAGREGGFARDLLHPADAARRRGAVPQGGAEAHRHDRRAPGPLPDAAPAAGHAPQLAVGDGEPRVAGAARVVGHHRVPAEDRPAPADADLAPDAQLPLLERHRRGAAAAAPVRGRLHAADRGVRGQHPAAAQEHRGTAGADRGRVPHRRHPPERGRDRRVHPEVDQGRQVGVPRRGGREPVHVADRHRPGARALPPAGGAGRRAVALGADRPARVAGAAVLHRGPRVHQHREELHRDRRLLRAGEPHHQPAGQPREARRQERGDAARRRRSSASAASTPTCWPASRCRRRGTSRRTA